MTHTGREAKGQTTATGTLPHIRAQLRTPGTRAPWASLAAATLTAALCVLSLLPAVASADGRIAASGDGLAVSARESGDIYLTTGNVIQEFHADGTFVRAFGWGVLNGAAELQTCTASCESGLAGSGTGQFNQADEVAVDNQPGPEYGDVYVVDQRNWRVEKFDPEGHFLLMFGGEVNKTAVAESATRSSEEDVCPAPGHPADTCGAANPGTGPAHFYEGSPQQKWFNESSNSIAVGPDGTVYVGDFRRVQDFDPDGTFAGELSVPMGQFIGSLAVDASSHVYVDSAAVNERQRVITPASGTYTLTFEGQTTAPIPYNQEDNSVSHPVRESLEALSTIGQGNVRVESFSHTQQVTFVGALAHANLPQMTASAGSVETVREGAATEVAKLGPSSEVLQAFDTEPGSEPTHIALDGANDLFVSDVNGSATEPPSGEFQFRAFKPSGALYAVFTSDQVTSLTSGVPAQVHGIATGANVLYATSSFPQPSHVAVIPLPEPGPPLVGEESATNIEPTTVTLHATINADGFESDYHFEYVTQSHFEAEGFANPEESPSEGIGALIQNKPISEGVSGLQPETTYRFRAVAESECEPEAHPGHTCKAFGEAAEFETLPPLSIRDFTTQTVGPELVKLKAQLSSNNGTATHYRFCIGEEEGNYPRCSPESPLAAVGNDFEEVTATFDGLRPSTEYHYVLIAHNSYGVQVETPDAAFTTEPSAAEEREAEDCSANGTVHGELNSTLREEDNSTALPDCRTYEMVSPSFKAGAPVTPLTLLAPSGDRAAFQSQGAFAGTTAAIGFNEYVAHRTEAGWVTEPTLSMPSASGTIPIGWQEYNAELDHWLFTAAPGIAKEEARSSRVSILYRGSSAGSIAASPSIYEFDTSHNGFAFDVFGQSADLSRIFLGTSHRLLETDERPGSPSLQANRIYEVSGAGGPAPSLSLAAEVPSDLTDGSCQLDGANPENSRWTSTDGFALFYTSPLDIEPGAVCANGRLWPQSEVGPNKAALFVRFGQSPPILISTPPATQCEAPSPCFGSTPELALYHGASPDASRAWFTTTQPLIDSDTDQTSDLYLAKLENGELSELVQASAGEAGPSHPTPGQGADVQGVLRSSPDASHIAFVATGVLTETTNPTTTQSAAQGADNLYVFDSGSRETKFIARLCSGPKESGSQADPACPSGLQNAVANDQGLWTKQVDSQFTPDGHDLLFTSYGRLVSNDTDGVQDVYRFNTQTGDLSRLSFGRNGNDGNGNDDAYPALIEAFVSGAHLDEAAEDSSRSISGDGSVAIFNTDAPLVSRDTNDAPDIYEWEEDGHGSCHEVIGCVSLISDGLNPHGAQRAVIGSSGRDITFFTDRGILPADTDGVGDVYDAREKGGFPNPRIEIPCPGNESCHGPIAPVPATPPVTTEHNESGGNGPHQLECGKGRHRVKKHGDVRCVPNKRHRKPSHKKHKRTGRRAANFNRGGSK